MSKVTMRDLLEAGIHFGHQTRRWNPKMARYIFGERNGIYIIDLQKTMRQLRKASAIVRDTVAKGGTILFVGTKRQAREPIEREATRCGMFYVNNRWLGGTLTNFQTVKNSVRTLTKYDDMEERGDFDKLSKKESSRLRKYHAKLKKNLSGVKAMSNLPSIMFVIDARKEAIAVREANRLGIPCIAIVDTNGDPDAVPLPVPGNDDAIRAVNLFCKAMADAVIEGRAYEDKTRSEDAARAGRTAPAPAPQAEAAEEAPVKDEASTEEVTENEDETQAEEQQEE